MPCLFHQECHNGVALRSAPQLASLQGALNRLGVHEVRLYLMWHFVKTAAASRKLADAVLSILIERPPCYSSHVERSRRCARGVLRRPGQWATDWHRIMRRDFPE